MQSRMLLEDDRGQVRYSVGVRPVYFLKTL